MNIRQSLLTEHSRRQTMAIVDFIGTDAERFAELMEIFFAGEYRLTQRAAWPMNYCAERHPELILPYLPQLLDCLEREDLHVAVRRNVMRLLQYIEIPKRLTGRVYAHAIDLIDDAFQPAAVRAFALTVATRIAKTEPDLLPELQLIVSQHLSYAPAAFRVRAREILKNNTDDHADSLRRPGNGRATFVKDDW